MTIKVMSRSYKYLTSRRYITYRYPLLIGGSSVGLAWTNHYYCICLPFPSAKKSQNLLKKTIFKNGIIADQTSPPTKIGPLHQPLLHYLLLPQAVSCDVAHIAAKIIPWVLPRCAKRYSLGGDSANNRTIMHIRP